MTDRHKLFCSRGHCSAPVIDKDTHTAICEEESKSMTRMRKKYCRFMEIISVTDTKNCGPVLQNLEVIRSKRDETLLPDGRLNAMEVSRYDHS